MRLFAYDSEQSVYHGGDPHAVQIEIADEDVVRVGNSRDLEHLGRWEIGTYVEVTDKETGERWKVASAPCGQPCHCAAVALPVKEGGSHG